jgi:2-alkenal reductase
MKKIFNLGLGLFLVTVAGLIWSQRAPEPKAERPIEPRLITPRAALLEPERAMINLFDQTAPSVAYITTESLVRQGFFGEDIGISQGAGSGFVWDAKGHVVTNNHVVANAQRVLVQLDAGKEPLPARVVGRAPQYDLAVVQLIQVPPNLRPIPLGRRAT